MRKLGKPWAFASVCLLSLLSACEPQKSDRPDASAPLIEAFQGGCTSTKGRWTDAALSQSKSLVHVFQKLKETDPCKGLTTRLALIEDYTQNINQLLQDEKFRVFRVKEENLKELTLALAQTSDPNLVPVLQAGVAQAQIDLAESRAESMVSKEITQSDRLRTFSSQLTRYSEQLLADTGGLAACLRSSPAAAFEIATHLIAMGGSLVSPIYGAGSQVIGNLINFGLEYARTAATEQALWELYQVQMAPALTCGLEAMTELYCQAAETQELISMQSFVNENEKRQGNAHEILELYSRHMPVLVDWLRDVRNGLPASDGYEAERQINAKYKLQQIESADIRMKAAISQLQRIYLKETDPRSLVTAFLRDRSQKLAPRNYGETPPFSALSQSDFQFACWLTRGYGNVSCEKISLSQTDTLETYIRDQLIAEAIATFQDLPIHWQSIVDEAMRQANSEYFDNTSVDVRAIFQRAREASPTDLAPREVLSRIVEFLARMEENPNTPADRLPLLRTTRRFLRNGLDVVNTPDDVVRMTPFPAPSTSPLPVDPDREYKERLREVYDLFHLKDGTQFFVERVGNFVLWDLNDRLKQGEFNGSVEDILRYLGGDLRSRLLSPGNGDIQSISDDLAGARSITEGNLGVFREFFKTSLGKVVDKLHTSSQPPLELPAGADRPNGQILGKLCSLVLVTGKNDSDWPQEISWEACQAAAYYYPGDPKKAPQIQVKKLREDLKNAPNQTRNYRMCGYHRYIRETRIGEILADLKNQRSLAPQPDRFSLMNLFFLN